MTELVSIERDDEIGILTLNRPDRLNAFNLDMAEAFLHGLQEVAIDRRISVVVITGSGRAFCAGGDLAWARAYPGGAGAAFHVLVSCFHQSLIEIAKMEKPVIAAVNGAAAGGGFSLALASDFRIMDARATLRQGYTSAGLSINGGGTFMLTRLIGLARALEIAALDEPISAERAHAYGLAIRVVEQERSLEEARRLARELSGRSLRSFAWSKLLLRSSYETPFEVQLERERQGLVACARDPEGKEGLEAFLDKRKPDFRRARAASMTQNDGSA